MQIDFHHTVTYLCARLAGFEHEDANIVAYSAQYVDDATNEGIIQFNNGALYRRISSAHKMIDYRNIVALNNHLVWIPFHFLPGNAGLPAGENPEGSFVEKLVCKPNSYVAQDMIKDCVENHAKRYSLHRLGITAHVLADTWGHQGFAGVSHKINNVENLEGGDGQPDADLMDRIQDYFSIIVRDEIPPLGHGKALSNPDLPFADWSYTNGLGDQVIRDNPNDFVEAADALCMMCQKFIAQDPEHNAPGLTDGHKEGIKNNFLTFDYKSGDERHEAWRSALAADQFGIGPVDLPYIPKGIGSWKHEALETEETKDSGNELFNYSPDFLNSNWKLFHDAAKAHRLAVIDDILPRYGICAA